jgi:osmotically-inducible protein OsmY
MHRTHLITAVLLSMSVLGCDRGSGGAEKSASTTAQQVERQLEKGAIAVDDATISAKIKTILIADPGLKGFAIDVDTSNNVVTLKGAVESEDARREAERIARSVAGVKSVTNNLTVKPKS